MLKKFICHYKWLKQSDLLKEQPVLPLVCPADAIWISWEIRWWKMKLNNLFIRDKWAGQHLSEVPPSIFWDMAESVYTTVGSGWRQMRKKNRAGRLQWTQSAPFFSSLVCITSKSWREGQALKATSKPARAKIEQHISNTREALKNHREKRHWLQNKQNFINKNKILKIKTKFKK